MTRAKSHYAEQVLVLQGCEIPLTRGLVALVDEEDYVELSKVDWYAAVGRWNIYACRSGKRREGQARPRLQMHRVIFGLSPGRHPKVDHINGNGLDNRRSNLRVVTTTQNAWNSVRPKGNTSGFKGVSFDIRRNNWRASIRDGNRKRTLGRFATPEEAAHVYDLAARKLRGEFALTNGLEKAVLV